MVGWVVVCKVIFVSNPTSVEVKLVLVDVVVGVVTISFFEEKIPPYARVAAMKHS